MKPITPVLLAGGSGTRLWPLSRKSYPKQFSKLIDEYSLFQKTALRLTSSEIINFEPHIILTHEDFRFIIGEQLLSIGIKPGPILIEPEAKNTAPAIIAASLIEYKKNKDSIILIAPSDHLIPDTKAFHMAVLSGLEMIEDNIITFGINPKGPETGYGYLELEKKPTNKPIKLKSFVEKPNKQFAIEMLEKGNFLWNSGIFMFKAKNMIKASRKYIPEIISNVDNAIKEGHSDLDFFRLSSFSWSKCEAISIDYALMEKLNNLVSVNFKGEWSDLGDWNSVWAKMNPDINGVAISKNAIAFNCQNTLLRSESVDQKIVGYGLENIIAISMSDAVLIANKNDTQQITSVVKKLNKKNIKEASSFRKDYRPWGWFDVLALDDRFQIKLIFVKPSGSLSLQSHKYRSEFWVVVKGKAKVTIGNNIKIIPEGNSVYIPKTEKHRLENPNTEPILLVEVQIGSYLGEDDIIRYEDIYSRK